MNDKTVKPYTTGLDEGNAYWMARLSKEVYLTTSKNNQHPNEKKILANLKKDDEQFLSVFGVDNNSAQAALIEHENYYCMSFRGTNEFMDWIDNINALSVEELFGGFHRGFWKSVDDVWQPLYSKLMSLNTAGKKRPLFITGHSLGGAMATIAAARLIHLDQPFTSVYTFGQPRALTRNTSRIFNAECKSRYFRFHNNNDIVTRVPARIMNYSHIGTYLYISDEKEIHKEAGFWFKFIDAIDGAVSDLKKRGLDGINDHDINRYLHAIESWDFK